MERIGIRTITNKTSSKGVPFWSVEGTNGQKYTCWDLDLSKILDDNLGKEVDMDIKQSGNFMNIRGVKALGASNPTPINQSSISSPLPSINQERDKSIVAQCLVKAVLGQVDSKCEIKDAVLMYKEALELLK